MDRRDDSHLAPGPEEGRVLSLHLGRSANCSSVGSVVDVLFVSTVVGSALLAAAAVLLSREAGDGGGEPEAGNGEPGDGESEKRDREPEAGDGEPEGGTSEGGEER